MEESEPRFIPFNPRGEVEIYHRHLPHWRQTGATYFITFRLADSIPRNILLQWREERELWLKVHGITADLPEDEKGKRFAAIPEKERKRVDRDDARRLHLELDRCHGSCMLRSVANAEILDQALCHFHGQRCRMGDFVIMPNHVHLLAQPFDAHPLEDWLQSVKSYAARRMDKAAMAEGKVFQQESYDRIVRNREELDAYRNYIEKNGAKAGLKTSEYRYHRCDWL
ncbi:MAG: transposase [Kiritimatiellales bacterium]|nr:transposase [Kiritimatiellales bacterium]MCF7863853.1 transposase [Kiritimatiellales bacterium]